VEQATAVTTLDSEVEHPNVLEVRMKKTLKSGADTETLNSQIAILWKAVQELSEQNAALRDELALERSERETLRATNDVLSDDVSALRTQLNALTDLIAGKATVTVRS
ncbi:MAG: hypothetical protein ACRCWQ_01940, partial [Bacilli bacterium]